jgi:hypothetical protein
MTMKKANTIEDELDATRIKLFEATKGMTTTETQAYYSKFVAPIYEKYGIKPIARVPQRAMKIKSDNSD